MKIHSSSLASIPARYKANNHNQVHNTRTQNDKDSLQDSFVLTPLTPSQDRSTIKTVDLPPISKVFQQPSINSRAHQALNAYIQETNQPLKNQRSEVISGIDFFV
jgi:hypothetical protein